MIVLVVFLNIQRLEMFIGIVENLGEKMWSDLFLDLEMVLH